MDYDCPLIQGIMNTQLTNSYFSEGQIYHQPVMIVFVGFELKHLHVILFMVLLHVFPQFTLMESPIEMSNKIYHETLCHTQIGEIKHYIFADTPGSNEVLKFAWMLGSTKISVQRLFDDMIFKVHQDVNCSEENCTNPTCRSIRLCLYPMFGCV